MMPEAVLSAKVCLPETLNSVRRAALEPTRAAGDAAVRPHARRVPLPAFADASYWDEPSMHRTLVTTPLECGANDGVLLP